MPKRIQRRRTKGWRMPEGAVYVGRTGAGPSLDYGNRYAVGEIIHHVDDTMVTVRDRAHAVQLYREWFAWQVEFGYAHDLTDLRGRDLACWCGLCPAHRDGLPLGVKCVDCSPCHADVMLELANADPEPSKLSTGEFVVNTGMARDLNRRVALAHLGRLAQRGAIYEPPPLRHRLTGWQVAGRALLTLAVLAVIFGAFVASGVD